MNNSPKPIIPAISTIVFHQEILIHQTVEKSPITALNKNFISKHHIRPLTPITSTLKVPPKDFRQTSRNLSHINTKGSC